jgi:hypothetical protein
MMLVAVWVALVGYAALYAGMYSLSNIGSGKKPYSVFDALTGCPEAAPAQAVSRSDSASSATASDAWVPGLVAPVPPGVLPNLPNPFVAPVSPGSLPWGVS